MSDTGKTKKAMIFAAGLGTRLRPLTDSMPKALVPLNSKPLLEHVMTKLAAAGFADITVNVHHFAEQIKTWLGENTGADAPSEILRNVRVSVSDETDLLRDTGGGIFHARKYLSEGASPDDFFLVHNVDIISNLDISRFAGQADVHPDALAILLVSERETSRYLLFDERMRLVGWTNIKTGEVKSPYPGIDPSSCRRYAFSGIHLISQKIFLEDAPEEKFPIIDFYLSLCASRPIYGLALPGLSLTDVGKPENLTIKRQELSIYG